MKFMLVGAPKKDSAWLHLDANTRIGVSIWHNGVLKQIERPVDWLAACLWVMPVPSFKLKTRRPISDLSAAATFICIRSLLDRDRVALAEGLGRLLKLQCRNGAPAPLNVIPATIGHIYTVEQGSSNYFLLGITRNPICNVVLL